MAGQSRRTIGRFFLWSAGVVGGIHAAFSLFWAAGGDWLLDTVGEGAVRLQKTNPIGTAALLLTVGAVKLAGAALPLVVELVPGAPFRRVIRFLSWIGGCFLIVYGTAYALLSASVLNGWITVSGAVDERGLSGHAYLWDPLFAVWGAALVVGTWLTRRRPPAGADRRPARSGPAPTVGSIRLPRG
jgi:uncharacterized protein DUF3995